MRNYRIVLGVEDGSGTGSCVSAERSVDIIVNLPVPLISASYAGKTIFGGAKFFAIEVTLRTIGLREFVSLFVARRA